MKRFKVGLVGCGHISATHLGAWARTGACAAHGVFDPDRARASERARQFRVPRVFERLEDLVEECDVVDVCTPPDSHAEIALRVLEAGRHLVIEKPLVIDVRDWDRLAARQSGAAGTITVIHNQKYLRCVRKAKRWLDAGRIGEVIRVSRQFLTSPASDRMLGGDKHWSHGLPGGRWYETLPHALYTIHQFAGPLRPVGVAVAGAADAPRGVSASEVVVTLEGERCLGTIHYSARCRPNRRAFTVQGTEGRIVIDRLGDVATVSRLRDRPWNRAVGVPFLEAGATILGMIPDRAGYLYGRLRGDSPHAGLIRALDRHLQGQGPPPTPLAEIDYVVRSCHRIGLEIDRAATAAAAASTARSAE